MEKPLIKIVDVHKRFGDVVALDGVNLDIYPNEILVVLGENGSGKSTLAKILYGLYTPDKGYIVVDGKPTVFTSPNEAKKKGIIMISQRPQLIDELTILENISLFLGEPPTNALRRRVSEVLSSFGIKIDVDKAVYSISYTEKQFIDLLKAVLCNPRLLIVDEAATYLPHDLKLKFFNILRGFVSQNKAVIYITHKIPEALEIGDRFAVLRRGRVAGIYKRGVDADTLRYAMFGSKEYLETSIKSFVSPSTHRREGIAMHIDNITVFDDYGKKAVDNLSLAIGFGEVVAIVGVAGNGQKELGEAIAGFRKVVRGRIKLDGEDITDSSPSERVKKGLVYIPEDPFREGVALTLTIAENMKMYAQGRLTQEAIYDAIKKLGIVPENPGTQVAKLSGGNIQKVCISKLLFTMPKVVVAFNPTRMLDEKSRLLVLTILKRFTLSGGAVLLISEDLDEALQISNRIGVIASGKIIRFFEGENLEQMRREIERVMVYG